MCTEICQRCYFIENGIEIDNDGYYYDECPKCGYQEYDQVFCHKCFKIFDYDDENIGYNDICKECLEKIEFLLNGEELKVEFDSYRENNILFLKSIDDKHSIRENFYIYLKDSSEDEEYIFSGKIYDFCYALTDSAPKLFLSKKLNYYKKVEGIYRFCSEEEIARNLILEQFMNILKTNKEYLKALSDFYNNIRENSNEIFLDTLRKIRLKETTRINIKSELLDFILYDKSKLDGSPKIYKVAIGRKEIIIYLSMSDYNAYNDEWDRSEYAFYFCDNGYLTKTIRNDYEESELPKINDNEYIVVEEKRFIEYVLRDFIENPFAVY